MFFHTISNLDIISMLMYYYSCLVFLKKFLYLSLKIVFEADKETFIITDVTSNVFFIDHIWDKTMGYPMAVTTIISWRGMKKFTIIWCDNTTNVLYTTITYWNSICVKYFIECMRLTKAVVQRCSVKNSGGCFNLFHQC